MLQASSLAGFANIRHAFFTRAGGISGGIYASLNGGLGSKDAPENVRENRARMAAALRVAPDHLVTAYQIHSADVIVADKPWVRENAPRGDAVVTQVRGLAVGVTTADCGPVLLADATAGVVGAAHAGWKGAFSGILEATIAAMVRLGGSPAQMVAVLGPMIRQASYEVGPEFRARFLAAEAANERFFVPAERQGHALFDLGGYVVERIRRAGIRDVEDLGHCTYSDGDRFFSYRRATHRGEGDYGRHINAIALTD